MPSPSKGPPSPAIPLNTTRLPDGSPVPVTTDPVAAEMIRDSENSSLNSSRNVNLRVVQGLGGSDPPSNQENPEDEAALKFLDMLLKFGREKPEGVFFSEYYEQKLSGKSKVYTVSMDSSGVPNPDITPKTPGSSNSSSPKPGPSGSHPDHKTPTKPTTKPSAGGGGSKIEASAADPFAATVLVQTEMFIRQQETILREEIADALPRYVEVEKGEAMQRVITQLIVREVTLKIANFLVPLMTNYVATEAIPRLMVEKFGPSFAEVAARLKDGTYLCKFPCMCETLKCDDPACKICYPEGIPTCQPCSR